MSEKVVPFVVTDRRKFNLDGEPRPEFAESQQGHASATEREPEAPAVVEVAAPAPLPEAEFDLSAPPSGTSGIDDPDLPPAPTAEQMEQSRLAFEATAERLDTAIRATNPGMEHPPQMSFDRLVQSVYMTAIMQLGGGTPEGQQPQLDLLGARQSIDMLAVISDKSKGNLSSGETRLLDSALFELRLGFLEITQALSRQAAARNQTPGQPAQPGAPRPGFGIVR